MQEQLLSGQQVNETTIVDLIVAQIKNDFPYVSEEEWKEKLRQRVEREEEIGELLERAESMRGKSFRNTEPINEHALQEELKKLRTFDPEGYVVVDYPQNTIQAHKLEAALSGYLPTIDREINLRREKLKQACRIIEPSEKPIPPE